VTFGPMAWIAWSLAALAVALVARNPFIQALLLLVLANAWLSSPRRTAFPLRTVAALALLPVALSLAGSRFGAHPLFTLPTSIPLVGGRWTLEAALFGATAGAALSLTVMVLALVQARVSSAEVLALLPHPFYRVGSTLALALAFVPQTLSTVRGIVEVRRPSGAPSGWRAAPMLLMPVLLTALERSLQYAESLDSRGFASRRRTRYRPLRWQAGDAVAILAAALAVAALALSDPPAYDPYQRLLPAFPAIASLASLLALALPSLLETWTPRHAPDHA
jgi:energy-coupling factor transport system permease protein